MDKSHSDIRAALKSASESTRNAVKCFLQSERGQLTEPEFLRRIFQELHSENLMKVAELLGDRINGLKGLLASHPYLANAGTKMFGTFFHPEIKGQDETEEQLRERVYQELRDWWQRHACGIQVLRAYYLATDPDFPLSPSSLPGSEELGHPALPMPFLVCRQPVYWFADGRQAWARRWHVPRENIVVCVVEECRESEASAESESVHAEKTPQGKLPAALTPDEIAAVLLRLPQWRRVCFWNNPPFPPDCVDGDNLQHLPDEDRKWAGQLWSSERWRQDWIDIFPSQLRSHSARTEILRQWSGMHRQRCFEIEIPFAHALALEDPRTWANPSTPVPAEPVMGLDGESVWTNVIQTLVFDPPETMASRLAMRPICAALICRDLGQMVRQNGHGYLCETTLRERTDQVEREVVPLARASLRNLAVQDHPAGVAEMVARLWLLLGEPADMDALRRFTTVKLPSWPLTASVVGCLAAMNWLQELDLSNTYRRWAPADLSKLSGLKKLRKLGVAGLDLHNSNLRFLRELCCLEDLDLSGNGNLSDGGVTHLVSLPSLRRLDLRFNPHISEQCRRSLQSRLSGCEIVFE